MLTPAGGALLHCFACTLKLYQVQFAVSCLWPCFWLGPTRWAHYLDCYRFLRKVGANVCPRLSVVLMGSVMCRLEPQAFRRAWSSLESWEICASESLHGLTLISGYVQVCVCVLQWNISLRTSLQFINSFMYFCGLFTTWSFCPLWFQQVWRSDMTDSVVYLLPLGVDWETGAVIQLTESQIGTSVIKMSHFEYIVWK